MTLLLPRVSFIPDPRNNIYIRDIIITSKEVWTIMQRIVTYLS